jgi:hypothetical protein
MVTFHRLAAFLVSMESADLRVQFSGKRQCDFSTPTPYDLKPEIQ